jgi:hypothetical protein
MLGYNWRDSAHGPDFEFNVRIAEPNHPITQGLPDFWHNRDELYHNLKLHPEATNVRVLTTAFSPPLMIRLKRKQADGTETVIDWCAGTGNFEPTTIVTDYGKGRCLHITLCHWASSMEDNGFRTLLTRGVEWAATGKVTLPVIQPFPPARSVQFYARPQVVVEGLEQHLGRKEYDRIAPLFASDGEAMAKSAQENAESILTLIRALRIPQVKWQTQGDRATWALPDAKPDAKWWRIECVKQGAEWKIARIE